MQMDIPVSQPFLDKDETDYNSKGNCNLLQRGQE